jgi:hypothetical protein
MFSLPEGYFLLFLLFSLVFQFFWVLSFFFCFSFPVCIILLEVSHNLWASAALAVIAVLIELI